MCRFSALPAMPCTGFGPKCNSLDFVSRCALFFCHAAWFFVSCALLAPHGALFPCHSERSEESSAWMLRFAQHDKHCHSEPERGIQCDVDASLRFAQHDKTESVIPSAFSCHSERSEGIQCDVDASLRFAPFSMTKLKASFQALFRVIPSVARNPVWMLRSVQHDKTENVIPSAARNPVRCGCFTALRSA